MPFFASTAIARAEYDPLTHRLQVWFRNGVGPYTYFGVPESVYLGLLNAPSKGRYFDIFIKDVYGR